MPEVSVAPVRNFVGGEWREALSAAASEVVNPATGEVLAHVPAGGPEDVAAAVEAAGRAFPDWQAMPPGDRIQYLFRFKNRLEEHFDEIARLIVTENGKTLAEARAELRRGIENVEVACGIPTLMQGHTLENIAAGIDEIMVRQPLGVVAAITPFNFPAMIPLWFLPYGIACGNAFILKPSERVPLSAARIIELLDVPKGVVNLVNGGKPAVDALLDHPDVRAISFVGSTPVARYIYSRGSAAGKRVQCQGGAKNHVVIMPDADRETTTRIISDSAFGCAGQRCLAVSVAVTVGESREWFRESITRVAGSLRVGNGLDESVQMGPVITAASRQRIEQLVAKGVAEGAEPALDGRGMKIAGYERGNFVGTTVLDGIPSSSELAETEIFGPVLSVIHATDLDDAIQTIARNSYGNASSIFTTSGAAARKFRHQVPTGNVGVNIGVAAPMAYFPFSGWRGSFFGVLHAQGRDGVEFYTDKKVIIERWPKEWSRRF